MACENVGNIQLTSHQLPLKTTSRSAIFQSHICYIFTCCYLSARKNCKGNCESYKKLVRLPVPVLQGYQPPVPAVV